MAFFNPGAVTSCQVVPKRSSCAAVAAGPVGHSRTSYLRDRDSRMAILRPAMAPDRHHVSRTPRLRFAFLPKPPVACLGFGVRYAVLVWVFDAWRIARENQGSLQPLTVGLLAGLFRGLFATLSVA